jgi:hypothetical protein
MVRGMVDVKHNLSIQWTHTGQYDESVFTVAAPAAKSKQTTLDVQDCHHESSETLPVLRQGHRTKDRTRQVSAEGRSDSGNTFVVYGE